MIDTLGVVVHSGVKGMRWGVRRSKPQKQGPSKDSKRTTATLTKAKRSQVKSLTNKELKEANQRLEMEKKFKQLKPRTKLMIGIAAAGAIIAGANKGMTFINSPAGKIAMEQGKNFVDATRRGTPATAAELSSRLASLPSITTTGYKIVR